jgi:hypothetical protein
MTHDEKLEMITAMRIYGGSFVCALADCFAKADANNFSRLLLAFPEYVKQYRDMADKSAAPEVRE